jgi:hypothetical protein
MHRGVCWCGCGIAADVEDEDNGDGGWAEHTIVEGNEMTRIRRNNMRLQSVDSSHCSGELVHGRRIVIIVMVQQCWWRLVSLLWYHLRLFRRSPSACFPAFSTSRQFFIVSMDGRAYHMVQVSRFMD